VALPSSKWGQKVALVAVLTEAGKAVPQGKANGKPWSVLDMRRAMKDKLVAYKIPQEMRVVDSLPRNAMGKSEFFFLFFFVFAAHFLWCASDFFLFGVLVLGCEKIYMHALRGI